MTRLRCENWSGRRLPRPRARPGAGVPKWRQCAYWTAPGRRKWSSWTSPPRARACSAAGVVTAARLRPIDPAFPRAGAAGVVTTARLRPIGPAFPRAAAASAVEAPGGARRGTTRSERSGRLTPAYGPQRLLLCAIHGQRSTGRALLPLTLFSGRHQASISMLLACGFPARKRPVPPPRHGSGNNYSGDVLLSQGATPQVPSALAGLTSVFGMGTGVTPPLWPPETLLYLVTAEMPAVMPL